jgi:hypothetical protein
MRTWALGTLVIAGLAMVAVGATPEWGEDASPPPSRSYPVATASDQLIALASTVDQRYRQLIVVDPKRCAVAVYHIELATGAIELVGERNISADLEMSVYNGKNPLPAEIRSQLQYR